MKRPILFSTSDLAQVREALILLISTDQPAIHQQALSQLSNLFAGRELAPLRSFRRFRQVLRESAITNQPAGTWEGVRAYKKALLDAKLNREQVLIHLRTYPNALGFSLCLATSADGYLREAALTNLYLQPPEIALPFAMYSIADGVASLAEKSEAVFWELYSSASSETLAAAIPSFLYLQRKGLYEYDQFSDSYFERYPSRIIPPAAAYRQALESRPGLLSSLRSRVTHREERALLDQRLLGPDENWDTVTKESSISNNQMAVQWALHEIGAMPMEQRESYLQLLSNSVFVAARGQALEMSEHFNRTDLLELSLYDRNWRVRNDARFYLKKRGISDFLDRYRSHLPDPIAIAGFAEVAPRKDLLDLLPLIDHPTPSVRSAAIEAMGKFEVREAVETLRGRLTDSSSSVVSESLKAFRKIGPSLNVEEVKALLASASMNKLKPRVALKLTTLLSAWPRLQLLLELFESHPAEEVVLQLKAVLPVCGKSTSDPKAELLKSVEDLIIKHRSSLPAGLLSQLSFELAYRRRRRTTGL